MTSELLPTPVVVVEGDPCVVGGRAAQARLLFVLIRRGSLASIVALEPEHLTVVGDLTWANTASGEKTAAGHVRAVYVRRDRWQQSGIGWGMRHAAGELTGVTTWTGEGIPDTAADSWLVSARATEGQEPVPAIDLPDDPLEAEAHLVLHRAGRAVIIAFSTGLVRVGHLAWTINRPGGRVDGDRAGLTVGEVQRVDTRDGHGRQGIATRLYAAAIRVAADLNWPAEIDHNQDRTPEGDTWSKKVGGHRPPLTNGRPVAEKERLMHLFGQAP